jgi:hypothetical protein
LTMQTNPSHRSKVNGIELAYQVFSCFNSRRSA